MKSLLLLLCLSLFVLSAGCSSKEELYENLYEGFQMRERMELHPVDVGLQEPLSYDRYKKERDAALNQEPPPPADNVQ